MDDKNTILYVLVGIMIILGVAFYFSVSAQIDYVDFYDVVPSDVIEKIYFSNLRSLYGTDKVRVYEDKYGVQFFAVDGISVNLHDLR